MNKLIRIPFFWIAVIIIITALATRWGIATYILAGLVLAFVGMIGYTLIALATRHYKGK